MKKTAEEKKSNWEVRMVCEVRKVVYCQNCTEKQARENPWEFVTDEQEIEQIDWDVENTKEVE